MVRGGGVLQSEPLPQHKFSPHDVVALRPNKGDPSCEALAEGLVYRVKVKAYLQLNDSPVVWRCNIRLPARDIACFDRQHFPIATLLRTGMHAVSWGSCQAMCQSPLIVGHVYS